MTSIKVTFQRLDRELSPPRRAHHDDAGFDLVSATDVRLEPGERDSVPTGLAVAIPQGYAGLVLPRSGHAARYGVALVNSPGLIDAGYRGEIRVLMINHGSEPVVFGRGERIAQLVIIRLPPVAFEETDELGGSIRGDGGFGSTGS